MTPKERILATINRQPVDRAPIDLWCTPEVLDSLRQHTAQDDELAVYQALGLDKIVWIFPGYAGRHFDPNDSGGITPWGVPTRMVKSGLATYQEYIDPPLADYTAPAQLADYPWPDPDKFDYVWAAALADKARACNFATIGPWISHFEIYCQMRGMENAMMDTLINPEFMDTTLNYIDTIQTAMLERLLTRSGDRLDMIFISDDMGMQHNLLVSTEVWGTHFKPRLKRWCDLVHRHGKKVFYHTDGAVLPIIPGLIECGIDILNPIQHICPGMDRAELKRLFGKDLIFHGGIENQKTLPMGTTRDVVAETRKCMETLGKDGGYICCSSHNVQAGTPLENILAMIETVKAFGG
ncbi:uroporphyrinogen decarboxylase family protein [Geminisphaera colitermitum]|uniref:uroporphyrinogen decarboxylase family protein n=1 Tax=Geminisphaera colitermitum TaxID=1148786 RepID=UPI0005B80526|nr:uroporphyrinogen decarboxylase family protein [Geminisphaera colitermitum]